jgi:hypothetical protein
MAKYLIIQQDEIIHAVDAAVTDVLAMPLFGGGLRLSLIRARHFTAIQGYGPGCTPRQSLAALGLTSPVLDELYLTNPDPTNAELWDTLENLGPPEQP